MNKRLPAIFGTILLAAYLCGCKTTVAPGGAYSGDTFLYQTDQTITILKASLDAFVGWEYTNRTAILLQWPQVTVAADKVRAQAPTWFSTINLARSAYLVVRDGPAASDPTAISSARNTLTQKVNDTAAQVATAQAAVNRTALANRPTLKINP